MQLYIYKGFRQIKNFFFEVCIHNRSVEENGDNRTYCTHTIACLAIAKEKRGGQYFAAEQEGE